LGGAFSSCLGDCVGAAGGWESSMRLRDPGAGWIGCSFEGTRSGDRELSEYANDGMEFTSLNPSLPTNR
jgi:hypothetical protein